MNSILKPDKNRKANLERSRFLYFEIGLVLVLGIVFAAFNWPSGEEDFYYAPPPKDTSDYYIAKEVYMFKPLPESPNASPDKKVVVKTKPVKVNPVKVEPTTTVVKPIVVDPVELVKPDSTAGNKGNNKNENPLPPNLIRVDKKPQFPGGEAAMNDFIRANIKYNDFARKNNYSGTVFLKFMVLPTGKLTDFKVEKGVRNSTLNEEVIRVFSIMPTWEPGFRNGRPQSFMVSFPVRFEFED